jgi:hypothetical protein
LRSRLLTVRIAAPSSVARPVQPGRARSAVVAGAVLFLLAQAGFNHAVRTEAIPVRDPVFAEKFDLFRQRAAFFAPPTPDRPTRVLAVGSSRTHLAFDAGRFAAAGQNVEAFNFGCPAAGPMTSALYLRRLFAAGATADLVLVELHPGFLTPHTPAFEGQWLHAYRLREDEPALLRGFGHDQPTPPHHGWRGYLTAFGAYRFAVLNRYWPEMLPCPFGLTVGVRSDPLGFVPGIDLSPADRPKALERTRVQYSPVLAGYDVGGPGVAAVRDMLAQCKGRDIRTAVVVSPESSEFRSWYGDAGRATFARFAAELAAEFGAGVIDARDWVPDAAIADGHHLTPAGAGVFTDRLWQWSVASGQWSAMKGGS